MQEQEHLVLEAMKAAGKPVRPGDVAESTGLPKELVTKSINSLKKQGKVTSPKRCYYQPA